MTWLSPNNQTSDADESSSSTTINWSVLFWLFLGFDISAVLCNICVVYQLLSKRSLREALHNHVSIVLLLLLLIYELVAIPLHLQYFGAGVVRPFVPLLCLIWWFLEGGFYYTITMLLVFASVERHIMIFHSYMFSTMRKRVLLHYLPLMLIILYMMVFYGVAVFAPICENTFDDTTDVCGMFACYSAIPFFQVFEQVGCGVIAPMLMIIANVILLIRVIRQKYRVHRVVQWKKQRKLAIQMLSMSSIYLVFALPPTVVYLVHLFGHPNLGTDILLTVYYGSYFPVFLLPFACLTNLPKFWDVVERMHLRKRRVVPAAIAKP